MHFGIISPPVAGHIHPFGALGRELIARGHRVTMIQMADVEQMVREERLEFLPVGQSDHPPGSLPESLKQLGQLQGFAALRFTIRAVTRTTEMLCRDAPAAIRSAGIEMLLVDQTEPAGGTVAEHLKLPFVTICNALVLNRDLGVPPPFTAWGTGDALWQRARNQIGYAVSDKVVSSVTTVVARYRRLWGLAAHKKPDDSFSSLLQISQQPPEFDFPRRGLRPHFHYVGPLRDDRKPETDFPWHKLDGRPLVYASLGTLQNFKLKIFQCFAQACAKLDVQLIIAHRGGLSDAAARNLPGDPITVFYAPQTSLLRRARLALTHAGLNTVLDALRFGVPIVAVPITYEQPAIAARLEWTGAGKSLPLARLTASRLQETIQHVLNHPEFARSSGRIAESIRISGGVAKAASLIEGVAPDRTTACRSGS